ncbi:YEATS family protein [Coprinopsis cinerea okayama7|uniref:Protein AF-9 homolog n=1 Tax=Coprinopsis cinerea (strain Okayama-7 / 130 / ATCC MYA-4618 / FGSC 9003) TaxID=240176 RepID=A8NZ08_COPC7|nr:YEATS family protein [Coprinopsis cinerea okayama7\|eukprot:XP_001837573.1 YEATS family protein [Coprinopsis cinerea okayama7\
MSTDRVRQRGITIYRPIIYGNVAVALTDEERAKLPAKDHTHRWTVAVRSAANKPGADQVGGADDLSYFIKRVTFKLHDTYPNPTRNIDKPPFELSETGWGEFEIGIRITFIPEATEKPMVLAHHLKLHPWTATGESEIPPLDVAIKHGPVHSWQYDEIVFNDPSAHFLNILTQHPPTPLPKIRRNPVPFNIANLASFEDSKGGTPEFYSGMIQEEAERLEEARKKVIAEQERLRTELIEKEKELERLKKQLIANA